MGQRFRTKSATWTLRLPLPLQQADVEVHGPGHLGHHRPRLGEGVFSRFGAGDKKLLITTEGLYTPEALDRLPKLDGFCEIPEQVGMGTSSHLARIRQFLLHLPSTLFSADELQKQKLLTARLKKLKKRLSKLYESLIRGARSLLWLFRRATGGVTARIMGEERTFLIAGANEAV